MKISLKFFAALLLCSQLFACAQNTPQTPQQAPDQNHGFTGVQTSADEWWNIPYPQSFDASKLERKQGLIKIQGKGFVTESGQEFVFR